MYSCIAQLLESIAAVAEVVCLLDYLLPHACLGLGFDLGALRLPQSGHDFLEYLVVKNTSWKYCVSNVNRLGGTGREGHVAAC